MTTKTTIKKPIFESAKLVASNFDIVLPSYLDLSFDRPITFGELCSTVRAHAFSLNGTFLETEARELYDWMKVKRQIVEMELPL